MGDIGKERKRIILEPLEEPLIIEEPAAPEVPAEEPVPA